MEAYVYVFLLVSTTGIIFFAVFFLVPPDVPVTFSVGASGDRLQKLWQWKSPATTQATSSVANPSSSINFPLSGNVYPKGYYSVQVNLGQPPKPYSLDPDTGSDLTWVQCVAPCVRCTKAPHPPYRPTNDDVVPKNDPLCDSLHSSDYNCDIPEQCDYEVVYEDGGSSRGVLVKDVIFLNRTSGIRLAFGCQVAGSSSHDVDGVLGLGKGALSIVSQLHSQRVLKNVVGHCFSGRGGGFLFFGDDPYDSRVLWTSMLQDSSHSEHYSAGPAELILGQGSSGNKNLIVVFDSGSSYTYLSSQAYDSLLSWLTKELKGKPLTEAKDDNTLPFCWKGKEPFRSINEVKKYFKPLALRFDNGWRSKPQFEIPPEGYLIISSKGNACLGMLNGTEVELQNNVLGDISMQDKVVVYDNEKKRIGWGPANCDRQPNSNVVLAI